MRQLNLSHDMLSYILHYLQSTGMMSFKHWTIMKYQNDNLNGGYNTNGIWSIKLIIKTKTTGKNCGKTRVNLDNGYKVVKTVLLQKWMVASLPDFLTTGLIFAGLFSLFWFMLILKKISKFSNNNSNCQQTGKSRNKYTKTITVKTCKPQHEHIHEHKLIF